MMDVLHVIHTHTHTCRWPSFFFPLPLSAVWFNYTCQEWRQGNEEQRCRNDSIPIHGDPITLADSAIQTDGIFNQKVNQTQFPLVTNLWKWWRKRHFEIVVEEVYKDKWTQRRSAQDWLGGTCGEHVLCFPFSFASNSPPAQLFVLSTSSRQTAWNIRRGACV